MRLFLFTIFLFFCLQPANGNQNLEEQAQAIFKSWFIDFEPFGGKMPDDWQKGTLANLGKIVGGSTPSKAVNEYYTVARTAIAWITPKDLSMNKNKFISHGSIDITDDGFKNSSTTILPKGSVLFSSRAPIGYMAIAKNSLATNQGFKSIVPNEKIGNAYVYYVLLNSLKIIDGIAGGSTFKEISASGMSKVPIIIPTTNILNNFQNTCNRIFSKQENNEDENERLSQLRDNLLPKLMSGEINVEEVRI